jgi:hypothetical protein
VTWHVDLPGHGRARSPSSFLWTLVPLARVPCIPKTAGPSSFSLGVSKASASC